MSKLVKPTTASSVETGSFSVFLAGSIEQDKATNWQHSVFEAIKQFDCIVYNPRRDNWDPTWDQSPDNPEFRYQVEWELSRIERCDLVFFYFEPGTISPISLLELGFCIGRRKPIIVCCPKEFHRSGNVQITMEFNGRGHKLFKQFAPAVKALIETIKKL